MKKIKEFFGKLFSNRVLILPLIIGICLFAVVNFSVFKKPGNTKPNDSNQVNIDDVIIYPDRANSGMFTYERIGGGCVITGIKNGVLIDKYAFVILPETAVSGKVLGIADEAFKNTAIKGVVIPSSIITIGESAFENCTELKSVKFLSKSENTLASTKIGSNAFKNCTKLKEVTLSNAVDEVTENAFAGTTIETLILESNKFYLAVTDNGSIGGAVSGSTAILTLAEQNGEIIDDGTNDYLKYFYNLSERVVNNVTFLEYTLKGDIITINLNLSGGTLSSGVEGVIYRTKISVVKVLDSEGNTQLKVLDDSGKLVNLVDETIKLPLVEKLGYWFKEWRTEDGLVYTKIDKNISEDITLNAIFLPRLIFINYDLNGGTNDSRNLSEASDGLTYRVGGEERVLYPATKEYSMFVGWYIDADFKTKIDSINDDIFRYIIYSDAGKPESEIEKKKVVTLYAKFETILIINGGVVTGVNSLASGLTEIVIPQSVNGVTITSIADSAMENMYSLRKLTISARLTSIGKNAFRNCYMLSEINYSGAGLYTIGESAFENCINLGGFTIANSVITVGKNAFSGCINLKTVEYESGSLITKIEDNTFNGCRLLESLKLPSGVVEFGENAFLNCEKLRDVTFLNVSFQVLGNYAFSGIKGLTNITLDGTLESLGEGVFAGCSGLKKVSFVNGFKLTTIPKNTFYGATSLQSVILPESVKVIEDNAFNNCATLTSVSFGDGITKIGSASFKNTALSKIDLPKTCTVIGCDAFSGCNLKSVEVESLNGWEASGVFLELESKYDLLYALIKGASLTYTEPFVMDENGYITKVKANYSLYIIGQNVKGIVAGVFDGNNNFRLLFENESGWFSEISELKINNSNGNAEIIEMLRTSTIMNEQALVIEDGRVVGSTTALNKISILIIPEGVTVICSGAITGSETITKIVLPTTLIKIEVGAFASLTNLESVEFLDELYWGNARESVNLEDFSLNVQKVQELTSDLIKTEVFEFRGNELIGLTDVGKGMIELIVPRFVTVIGSYAFDGSIARIITISAGVRQLNEFAFVGASELENVIFSENPTLESIGKYCFKDLKKLKSFVIPGGVTTLGEGIFSGCVGITQIDLGGINCITDEMFMNCYNLLAVTGGQNVETIGIKAFIYCVKLKSFEFGNALKAIGAHAFYSCVSLKELNLNEGLLTIGKDAFNGCENIVGVVALPNSLREIGRNCFSNCFKLTTIIFGEQIEKIGAYLIFNNNGKTSVSSIIIKSGLVFSLCDNLSGLVLQDGIVIGEGDFVSGERLAHCFRELLYNYDWVREK